jgi:hypothetical protein
MDGPPTPAILAREAAKKCDSTFLGTSSTVIYLRILAGHAFSRPSSFMMLCSLRSTPTRVPPVLTGQGSSILPFAVVKGGLL